MNARRPSQTSAMVAFLRALAHDGLTGVPSFADPTAARLLPFPWSTLHAGVRSATRRLEPEKARRGFSPLVDILPLRTLHIDEEIAEAVARGCRQLVILGAGLDGRAHRLPGLASVTVFEVDHPATQADKRVRARGLPLAAHRLTYVPVDFEHERLAQRLREAGFDPSAPAVWIWEGVTMYLTDAAIAATLADVSGLSAPGSRLVVNYREPGEVTAAERPMHWWFTSRVKEPQIGDRSRDTMAREVEAAGLKVLRDSGGGDWAARYGAPQPTPHLLRTRDLVAEKP
jgi:methyltransferase (TIGR00027 family)